MAKKTLGDLLPEDQAAMLTDRAKRLTKKELEEAVNRHPDIGMYFEDMRSLRRVAITRVNRGDSPFTWSAHSFSTEDKEHQHPSTCACFI